MIKVIFVCMGNICRSPAAQTIMEKLIKKDNLKDKIICDSAGTIAYLEGEPADQRMKRHALHRGYRINHTAKKFKDENWKNFDYVIATDKGNYSALMTTDSAHKYASKLFMITDFANKIKSFEVPDPYYSGPEGFELVLDILEDACHGLLNKIKHDHNL